MHKWTVLDGWIRVCDKCRKHQCLQWVSICIPKISRWETQQIMGWPWRFPIIAIELSRKKLFRRWKTVR